MTHFLASLILILSLVSCAQTRKGMVSHAFFRQSFAGAQLSTTDMNGHETVKGVDTVHTLYLQVRDADGTPAIDTVFVGQKAFTAKAQQLSEKELLVGTARWTDTLVRLETSRRHTWWKFELLLMENVYRLNRTGAQVVVKGHFKDRDFSVSIDKEIELRPDVRM